MLPVFMSLILLCTCFYVLRNCHMGVLRMDFLFIPLTRFHNVSYPVPFPHIIFHWSLVRFLSKLHISCSFTSVRFRAGTKQIPANKLPWWGIFVSSLYMHLCETAGRRKQTFLNCRCMYLFHSDCICHHCTFYIYI